MQYPGKQRFFRRTIALGIFSLVLLLSGCEKIELQRAEGAKLNWDQLRGQWVLVNYWAEWCKPCLEEIPELNALDIAPDIAVLGVNFDGIQGQALEELGKRMGIEFVLLAEDPAAKLGWDVPIALPATYIVGPDGDLVEARFGPQTEDDIRSLIGG
ncbi:MULTISPECIES: TlpA family protein disulfide reductase [Marinobacter]|uniref:TlpA disulfide reductase family protein n=1 Tax=Marinobacter suaedae TaxID=3057675 RepID=A0ABT8W0T4_9GAMM|nr:MULTISPECIES: TlpA disulfide reductase family protein [unclassified Marinobacter]MBZ2169864.1 TlpA family protein disulfide reductase [Marinobacter sp. F4216]MDO3721844.1 TlpA disulfide reductase family protein [Marinobacter sp. chi1]